ncbi:hypothetical protein GWI33_010231, partial [Rhynchophorus ferrugineus]
SHPAPKWTAHIMETTVVAAWLLAPSYFSLLLTIQREEKEQLLEKSVQKQVEILNWRGHGD